MPIVIIDIPITQKFIESVNDTNAKFIVNANLSEKYRLRTFSSAFKFRNGQHRIVFPWYIETDNKTLVKNVKPQMVSTLRFRQHRAIETSSHFASIGNTVYISTHICPELERTLKVMPEYMLHSISESFADFFALYG